MRFSLKTMDGNKYQISEEEYRGIIAGDGLIFIKSCGISINKSRIEAIYPNNVADEVEERKNQQEGILHDGTRVKRHFGQWIDAYAQVPDDNGKYMPVKLDESYYPEVARDCVPTPQEYEKIRHLSTQERLETILQGSEPKRLNTQSSMQNIANLLK